MKKISYLELAALILIITVSLNSGINFIILKNSVNINSWIAIILSYIIGFIPILLTIYISNYKQDLTISELINNLFGNFFGKIINIFLAIVLFIIGMTILYNVNSFTTSQFLYRTPIIISTILLVSLVIYNSNKGISVISRVCQILMCINFTLFIISFFSLVSEVKLDNFLPILKEGKESLFITSLKIASMNTLPIIMILVIPRNKLTAPDKYNKTVILSYLLGTIISLLIVIGAYGVLGKYLVNTFEYPEYMVLKKVKLFGFLERIENIVSIQWIIGSYMYLTIVLYNISKCIKHDSQKSVKFINLIIGVLLIITTNYFFTSITIFNNYIKNIFPYITSLLLLVYILLTTKVFINKRKEKV